ncbi:putative DNA-binding WGR domain protein [Rhizobium mongolense]
MPALLAIDVPAISQRRFRARAGFLPREDRNRDRRRPLAGSGRTATRAVRHRRLAQAPFFTEMNRSQLFDSHMSLDVSIALDHDASMTTQRYHLYIERVDPAKNMARYYAIEIGQTMFGEACLIRRWGRIGKRGQEKQHVFEREEEAVRLFLDLVKQKRARGYRPKTALRCLQS